MRALAALCLIALPVIAQAEPLELSRKRSQRSNAEAIGQGAASNNQTTSAETVSVGGNNVNNSYFSEFGRSSWYQFSEKGVRCEGPRFSAGIWADPGNQYYSAGRYRQDAHDLRGAIAVTIPFGGERVICQSMAKEMERRTKFDSDKGIVTACLNLKKSGLKLQPAVLEMFPHLEPCKVIFASAPLSGL
jgi:hypothetical protein